MTGSPFSAASRYFGLPIETRVEPDGSTSTFVARRYIPAAGRFSVMERVRLDGSERLDQLAARSYGDPALWWRIADASGQGEPAEVAGVEGRLLNIPLPLEISDDGDA
jgi:hypothetical protein